MTDRSDWMATQFDEHRAHLRSVAYRVLGSASDADDALQEAWLRATRSTPDEIANVRGWLTTVVARVSLNMLRSRNARREELDDVGEILHRVADDDADAEQEAILADSVGLALLVVLERLTPAERLAFVLHDMFDLPFEEIAPIVGRTPTAARQLASRARRRVRGGEAAPDADVVRRQEIVSAFLSAARHGEFAALLSMLDPDVVLRFDDALHREAGRAEVRGAGALVEGMSRFARAARFCRVALLDGKPGIVMAPHGRLLRAAVYTFTGDKISRIEVISDRERLRRLRVTLPAA